MQYLWCSCHVNSSNPTQRFATVLLPFRLEKKKIVDRRNDVMATRVRSFSCAVLLDGIFSCTTVPPMRMAISAFVLLDLNHYKYKSAKTQMKCFYSLFIVKATNYNFLSKHRLLRNSFFEKVDLTIRQHSFLTTLCSCLVRRSFHH